MNEDGFPPRKEIFSIDCHRSILGQETQELQRKQSWYQQNQVSMTKEDEEEYLNYCSEAMFRIHILEQRLNRYL